MSIYFSERFITNARGVVVVSLFRHVTIRHERNASNVITVESFSRQTNLSFIPIESQTAGQI